MLSDRRLRAAAVSIACNVLLVILKLIGARLSLSAAMKADALHSASDILISGLVFLSLCFGLRSEREPQETEGGAEETSDSDEEAGRSGSNATRRIIAENLTALLVAVLLLATNL